MLKKTVTILLALSVTLLGQSAHAANNNTAAAPQGYEANIMQNSVVRVTTKKTTRRVVTEKLKVQSKATRAKNEGRFVIGADNSNHAMTVYRSANERKTMPNLFKN